MDSSTSWFTFSEDMLVVRDSAIFLKRRFRVSEGLLESADHE